MPKTHPRRYRIESLVRETLAPMIMSALPDVIITVRHISLNNDFSVATVIYTTVGSGSESGNEETSARAQQQLEKHAWRYRRRLALALNMRKTPQLVFVYDADGLAADQMRAFLESLPSDE